MKKNDEKKLVSSGKRPDSRWIFLLLVLTILIPTTAISEENGVGMAYSTLDNRVQKSEDDRETVKPKGRTANRTDTNKMKGWSSLNFLNATIFQEGVNSPYSQDTQNKQKTLISQNSKNKKYTKNSNSTIIQGENRVRVNEETPAPLKVTSPTNKGTSIRNNGYGTILPVADVVLQSETLKVPTQPVVTSSETKEAPSILKQPAQLRQNQPTSGRVQSANRVINSYAAGGVEDVIDEIETAPITQNSSNGMKRNGSQTQNYLLDEKFSLDELLNDSREKIEEQPGRSAPGKAMSSGNYNSSPRSSSSNSGNTKESISSNNNSVETESVVQNDSIVSRSNGSLNNVATNSASTNQSAEHSNSPNRGSEEKSADLVLVSRQSPVLDVRTLGPKRIIVGEEALYQIRIRNTSGVAAHKLLVTTGIPETVDIADVQCTTGQSSFAAPVAGIKGSQNLWQVEELKAGAEEVLSLTLIPRSRANFNLDCRYDFEQIGFQAGIEVREAVLELAIEGSDSIEWGSEDKYRLRLKNTGNGDAENVRFLVTTGDNEQATQFLSLLKAGEEKIMDLSVRTRLDREILLSAEVTSEHGLAAQVRKSVRVLRGQLQVEVEAPELQFVNNNSDCVIRVRNIGNAALRAVDVKALLSSGTRFVSCTGSGQEVPARNQVVWQIENLNPGEQVQYRLVGQMSRSGENRIDVTASDKTGQTTAGQARIQVESIAALNMRLTPPNGPVPLGTPFYYELTVTNNGTKSAKDVNAGIMFPDGLRAVGIEENKGRIKSENKKVYFNTIPTLGVGQSVSWKVRVEAEFSGSHKTRAVVESSAENIRLTSEEMTYCYERNRTNNSVVTQRTPRIPTLPQTEKDLFDEVGPNRTTSPTVATTVPMPVTNTPIAPIAKTVPAIQGNGLTKAATPFPTVNYPTITGTIPIAADMSTSTPTAPATTSSVMASSAAPTVTTVPASIATSQNQPIATSRIPDLKEEASALNYGPAPLESSNKRY